MSAVEHTQSCPVPYEVFFETVKDFESYSKFCTGVNDTKITKQDESSMDVDFDLELVKRLEYSIRATHSHDKVSESATLDWAILQSKHFNKNNGYWRIRKVDANSCHVTYGLDIDLKFAVPKFVLNKMIKTNLPKAVAEFSGEAVKRWQAQGKSKKTKEASETSSTENLHSEEHVTPHTKPHTEFHDSGHSAADHNRESESSQSQAHSKNKTAVEFVVETIEDNADVVVDNFGQAATKITSVLKNAVNRGSAVYGVAGEKVTETLSKINLPKDTVKELMDDFLKNYEIDLKAKLKFRKKGDKK